VRRIFGRVGSISGDSFNLNRVLENLFGQTFEFHTASIERGRGAADRRGGPQTSAQQTLLLHSQSDRG